MKPIVVAGPSTDYLEFPADHKNHDLNKEQVEITRLVYKSILVGASSPVKLALYWENLLRRIEATCPSVPVIVFTRCPTTIEYRQNGNGFYLRARIATHPDMPVGFWEEVGKAEGEPMHVIHDDESVS